VFTHFWISPSWGVCIIWIHHIVKLILNLFQQTLPWYGKLWHLTTLLHKILLSVTPCTCGYAHKFKVNTRQIKLFTLIIIKCLSLHIVASPSQHDKVQQWLLPQFWYGKLMNLLICPPHKTSSNPCYSWPYTFKSLPLMFQLCINISFTWGIGD